VNDKDNAPYGAGRQVGALADQSYQLVHASSFLSVGLLNGCQNESA